MEEEEESQVKGLENISNIIIKENLPTLTKKIVIKVQETYRTSNRLDQKRRSPYHITKH